MASTPNDNVRVLAPKDLDDKKGRFVSGAWRPYLSVAEANQYNVAAYRYRFQEVLIKSASDPLPTVYWYQDGTADSNLVVKPGGSTPLYRASGPYKSDWAPGVFYGTPTAPLSGDIALDNTGAIDGTSIVIYHQAATEPTITGGTIDKKGTYDVNALNRLFILREIGNYYLVNIWSNAEVVTEPPAVTLFSIEATPAANTINEGDDVSIDVTATYSDGSTADVTHSAAFTKASGSGTLTGNTYATGTISANETAQINISYTEGGITRTDTVNISVINTEPGSTQLATPANFSAEVLSDTQINLTWSDVANESSYRIEASTDNSAWSLLNAPAANATSYSHTGLTASSTRYYRIKAVGNGTTYTDSGWATAQATTASIILFQDDFGDGVISATNYSVTETDPAKVLIAETNGKLQFTMKGGQATGGTTANAVFNNLTFNSGAASAIFDKTPLTNGHTASFTVQGTLCTAHISRAAAPNTHFTRIVVFEGSTNVFQQDLTNAEYTLTNRRVKITYDSATTEIAFWAWNPTGSIWQRMNTDPIIRDMGTDLKVRFSGQCISTEATDLVASFSSFRVANTNYSTELPV
ncbi:phage tail protein [Pontibacter beigongshangensis]|uniref:fibronectin type III domain-containing protein n=1 Tax=Pontibacter beigongshangensis TaxID=2574733 RepID=UPI00165000EE|nr:fibronectin type III domain-containing protein [Pontibacter beigongshangensis]